jgi:hypothetical protein
MFEKVVSWLKKSKPQDEPTEAEMKELAELIESDNPEGTDALRRMAKLLGQTE